MMMEFNPYRVPLLATLLANGYRVALLYDKKTCRRAEFEPDRPLYAGAPMPVLGFLLFKQIERRDVPTWLDDTDRPFLRDALWPAVPVTAMGMVACEGDWVLIRPDGQVEGWDANYAWTVYASLDAYNKIWSTELAERDERWVSTRPDTRESSATFTRRRRG